VQRGLEKKDWELWECYKGAGSLCPNRHRGKRKQEQTHNSMVDIKHQASYTNSPQWKENNKRLDEGIEERLWIRL
jgi:hypothetical protein